MSLSSRSSSKRHPSARALHISLKIRLRLCYCWLETINDHCCWLLVGIEFLNTHIPHHFSSCRSHSLQAFGEELHHHKRDKDQSTIVPVQRIRTTHNQRHVRACLAFLVCWARVRNSGATAARQLGLGDDGCAKGDMVQEGLPSQETCALATTPVVVPANPWDHHGSLCLLTLL